jgi:CelD/BcsL family acetyltransferase involved in cellulose biosynthesis
MTQSPATTGLQFARLTTLDQLRDLSESWDALIEHASDANTFLTPAWLLSWWEAYRPPASLMAISASLEGRLVGLAPMMLKVERRHGVAMRCLRFIGDGTFETDHSTLVADAAEPERVHVALLDELLRQPWDVAVLANVPESSHLARVLPDWCQRSRLLAETTSVPCPLRAVPESFEALLASLPSRFRTSIRSTRRKLAGANEVEFGLHDDPAEFGAALQALFDNHESRWRAKGQSGVFVKPQRREFYSILTRRLHERGALRFFYLKLDGRIVAQEYCFAHGRTVYLLQEGFDFALAQQNIGNALRSHVFEYLIEHRYAAYDFLAGVSRHKQSWSDSMPNDVTFTIARPTMKGRLAHYAPRLIERAKDGLRPLRDRIKGNRAGATGATAEAVTQ